MDFQLTVRKIKSGELSIAESSRQLIAFVEKLQDAKSLKECKAQAAAVLEYLARRPDGSVQEFNAAVTVKLRIEHRLGEFLRETVRRGGDRRSKSRNGTLNGKPKEISKNQSSRSQQLAAIPWKQLATKIEQKTEENEKASQAKIVKELLQEQQRKVNEQLVAGAKPLALLEGVFQTIVVDPPWDWDDEGDATQLGRGRHEYAAMSFDQLMDFPLGMKADKNAHLYMWITNRSLPKGFALMEKWDFRYVTCLTWCKPSVGMGNYFRGSTEHVLFGVRGSLALLRKNVGTWFAADRPGKHSAKPDEFYQLVETCSPGPWLDVFARKQRSGWTVWGAEA